MAHVGEHFREEFGALGGAGGAGPVDPADVVEIWRCRGRRVRWVFGIRGPDFGCGGAVEEDSKDDSGSS